MIIKVQPIKFSKTIGIAFFAVLTIFGIISCNNGGDNSLRLHSQEEAISQIEVPADSILLIPNEGLTYYQNQLFSGIAVKYYPNTIKSVSTSYYKGKKHGEAKKWFTNGLLSMLSNYQQGKLDGVSKTWWKNGLLRSESLFSLGIPDGVQKQWYNSGELFKQLFIRDGKEFGLQRAWRKNGKLYVNYEAKNGRIFGLKKSTLCYSLEDETIQTN